MSPTNCLQPAPKVAEPAGHRVVRLAGRPILALPVGPRDLRLAGLRRCRPNSVKKALFQQALRWTVSLGLDAALFGRTCAPLPEATDFDLAGWLDATRRTLGEPSAKALIVWPSRPDRRRVYIHLLRPDGGPAGFAKIALDEPNAARLCSEARTLRAMAAADLELCRLPRVLDEAQRGPHHWLLLEPLPAGARMVRSSWDAYPAACVAEYAGPPRLVLADELDDLDWFGRFRRTTDRACRFRAELDALLPGGPIALCRAHGDLGPSNVFRDRRRLWLIDWEESSPAAPCLTDEVSFYFSLNWRKIRRHPVGGAAAFASRYCKGRPREQRRDALLAVAFLHAAQIETASCLLRAWGHQEGQHKT